jgi:hypothetical protein
MARWRLINAHYLKVQDCFWEQKEIDQFTGKQAVKRYPVPRHLDPKDESDWNYNYKRPDADGEGGEENSVGIIVCWEGKGRPRDIVFIGDATPDMIPLDKEAREITAKLKSKTGFDPFDNVNIGDEATFSNHLLNQTAELFADAQSKTSEATAEVAASTAKLTETMAMLAELTATNTKLLQQLAQAPRRM